MSKKTPRLGKGLDALLGDLDEPDESSSDVSRVAVGEIRPNSFQPRREFSTERLEELAESIRVHGVVQPVIIRRMEDDYELVAGERRWRAAKLAGLDSIPAVIGDFTDRDMMEVALVENLQREDLSPIEEATAYRGLQEEFGLTQAQLAERIGKSRSQVANVLRLLQLPDEVQQLVQGGSLGIGHAKVVLAVPSARQIAFAQEIAERGMTVREAQRLSDEIKGSLEQVDEDEDPEEPEQQKPSEEDIFLRDIEDRLEGALGARVSIRQRGERGNITIEYFDQDDLQRLIDILIAE